MFPLKLIDKRNADGKTRPLCVMIAGFPDNQTSAFHEKIYNDLANDHRVALLCLPGYQKENIDDGANGEYLKQAAKDRPWGYSFPELVVMLKYTIDKLKTNEKEKIILVAHDWGSMMAQLFVQNYPDDVQKLILLDVGYMRYLSGIKQSLYMSFYMTNWAIYYFISQAVSRKLGEILLAIFFTVSMYLLPIMPVYKEPITIDRKELSVRRCYPYYHYFKLKILNDPGHTANTKHIVLKTREPTCPILYMVLTSRL